MLKDWKLVENKKSFKTFYKKEGSRNIWVFTNDGKIWMVDLDDSRKPIRRFKTKSQAIKYARQYMRTH